MYECPISPKAAEHVIAPVNSDLEATETSSDLCLFGPPGSADATLSVRCEASSAVDKRAKNHAATDKSLCTRKNIASSSGKIKLPVLLPPSSLAKPASSSQSSSRSVPEGLCHQRSSASPAILSSDVDDDGALVVLSNRNDSTGETSA